MADEGIVEISFWLNAIQLAINDGKPLQDVQVPPHVFESEDFIRGLEEIFEKNLETEKVIEDNEKKQHVDEIEEAKKKTFQEEEEVFKSFPLQDEPFERDLELDEYVDFQARIEDEATAARFEALRKTVETDHLPHLFKKQIFYKHVSDGFERSIATAIEATNKTYFLARVKSEKSGSIFREIAGAGNAEDELVERDISLTDVIERRIDNINPFQGKFVFQTAFGAPPTASVSMSSQNVICYSDLGSPVFGPDYTLYNTSTGSLHSSSFYFANGGDVNINGSSHGLLLDSQAHKFVSTGSITLSVNRPIGQISYVGKWEQQFTIATTGSFTPTYEILQKEYKPSVTNGSLNELFPTKKTVLINGNIVIT